MYSAFLLKIKWNNREKLKAGALAYAVIVSAFIAVSCGLLVLVVTIKRNQQLSQFERIRLVNNLKSGTLLLLTDPSGDFKNSAKFFGESDLVKLTRKPWGLMELNSVQTWTIESRDTLSRTFLSGTKYSSKNRALYVRDAALPLFIGGKSIIKGNIFRPKTGLKTGFMEGVPFSGKLEGKESVSNSSFPVDFGLLFEKATSINELETESYPEAFPTKHYQSFTQPTLIFEDQNINLSGKTYSGNILIQADHQITVDASTKLEDVILKAPKIVIKKGFRGSLQAFAKQELIVEEKCELKYPSVLGLLPRNINSKADLPNISISEQSTISGLIFSTAGKGTVNKSLIKIGKGSKVTGAIFTEGNIEPRGIVNGNVVCGGFHLKTNTKKYKNTLFDAVIDSKAISDFFIPPVVSEDEKERSVIKWLE